jgi:hypothetical protein
MAEVSGPKWCLQYPGSKSPDDLEPVWRSMAWAFIVALQQGGASVAVTATRRPPERAYLMYWSWMIANLSQAPAAVPPLEGLAIDWTHGGNGRAARSAAAAMVKAFGLEAMPSLQSRHIRGRAIDMSIGWQGTLSLHDFKGHVHHITVPPRDGGNQELAGIGASFGLCKKPGDTTHWSDDGT